MTAREIADRIMDQLFGAGWRYDVSVFGWKRDAIEAAIAAAERRMKERAAEVARAHRIVIGGTSEVIADAILALLPEGDGWMPTHRHVKLGTEYVLIGFGKIQSGTWQERWSRVSVDMRAVAICRAHDGSLWVWPREEFEDGRFETLPNPPTAKE